MEWLGWLVFVGFLTLVGWGVNNHLRLRAVEIDLNSHLGDLLVLRDSAPSDACRCCLQSRVLEFKALIREHFTL